MTRQQKRKIIKAAAVGIAALAGAFGLSRKSRRQMVNGLTGSSFDRHKILTKVTIAASFVTLMYVKSRIIPKYADDYPYSFMWDERYGNLTMADQKYERVRNLKDLVQSQVAHYKTWDGRVIADFFVQLFLMSDDKKPFDIVNTIMMFAQLLVCGAIGKGRFKGIKDFSVQDIILLTAGFWSCAPNLIATCFWLTGSVTYLWTGLIETLYVLPYALHHHNHCFSIPAPFAAVMGLAAGWSVETGAGAALMSSGLELIRSIRRKEASKWMYAGVLGTIAGMVLLLAAPGNRLKFTLERDMSDTLPESMDERLPGYIPPEYNYTPTMFKTWLKEGLLPTFLRELPLQIPVFLYFARKECHTRETTEYILGLEATAMAIPLILMLSPEYPRRAPYHSVLYLLPASLNALDAIGIAPVNEWNRLSKNVGLTAVGLLFINILSSLVVDADIHFQIRDHAEKIIRNKDKKKIILGDMGLSALYSFLAGDRSVTYDLLMGLGFQDPKDPYNKAAAAYYGIEEIEYEPYDTHRYYQKGRSAMKASLVDPLKSFVHVMKELFMGQEWPSSCQKKKKDMDIRTGEYK